MVLSSAWHMFAQALAAIARQRKAPEVEVRGLSAEANIYRNVVSVDPSLFDLIDPA